MKLHQIRKTETCGKEGNLYLRCRKLWGPAYSTRLVYSKRKKKTYSKLKLGSQNGCGPRIIQICNDRFYTSEEHTLNSSHTAGLGLLLRASKMTICATTLGPVYTETSCTGQEGRPLSRVNFSKRLCKKKVDPLARVKS